MNKMIKNLLFYKTFLRKNKPRLPKEYREVEWIGPASTRNSQRIDSGYINTHTTAFATKVYMTTSGYACIFTNSTGNTTVQSSNSFTKYLFYWFGKYTYCDIPESVQNRWIEVKVEDGVLTMDGVNSPKVTPLDEEGAELYILVGHDYNNSMMGRMAYFKIYESGELVRDFVPCYRKADDVTGFYDLCGSICPLTGTPFYINSNPNQSQDFNRGADVGGEHDGLLTGRRMMMMRSPADGEENIIDGEDEEPLDNLEEQNNIEEPEEPKEEETI